MAIVQNVEAFAVKQALSYLDKDPEKNLPKLLDWFDRFDWKDTLKTQRDIIRNVVMEQDNNWHQLVMSPVSYTHLEQGREENQTESGVETGLEEELKTGAAGEATMA